MRLNKSNCQNCLGYSLIEVSIAIAILAVGLVAIMGVLPAGLNVQRDNRQETIIKYEALYWMEALRSGGVALPIINRVDWIEVKTNNITYTADYSMLSHHADWSDPIFRNSVPPPSQIQKNYMIDLKRSLWRTEILGHLSRPDPDVGGDGFKDFEDATNAKRVRVRSFSGSIGKPLDYIMECQVLPDPGGGRLCTIRLTFLWPVFEKAWSDGPNARPMDLSPTTGNYDVEVGGGRKEFTIQVAAPKQAPPDYPGLAVMDYSLSLTNTAKTNGLPSRLHFFGLEEMQ